MASWPFPLYVAVGALVLLQTGSSRAIVLPLLSWLDVLAADACFYFARASCLCISMRVCLRFRSRWHWSMSVWGGHSSKIINDDCDWWLFKAINVQSTTHPGMNCVWRTESGPISTFQTAYPVKGLLMGYNLSQQARCLSITRITYI